MEIKTEDIAALDSKELKKLTSLTIKECVARFKKKDDTTYCEQFKAIMDNYPEVSGNKPKQAYSNFLNRLKDGYTFEQIWDGMRKYCIKAQHEGKIYFDGDKIKARKYVHTLSNFLGEQKVFLLDHYIPEKSEQENIKAQRNNIKKLSSDINDTSWADGEM